MNKVMSKAKETKKTKEVKEVKVALEIVKEFKIDVAQEIIEVKKFKTICYF